ncbi:MAG: carbohydrate kinase family protein [Pseudomonadota bacterium]
MTGSFPAVEGYGEIEAMEYMIGGEAANSSIVLARLGESVLLDGNWLGDDQAGNRTRNLLANNGIDTSRLQLRTDYSGVEEVIFAADGRRTIFGTYGSLLEKEEWNSPIESDVTASSVVSLDPFFRGPALTIAKTASKNDIPVVTVDCRHDDPLLPHVAAVVVAESFIREHYSQQNTEALLADYAAATDGLVIFTFGDKPIVYTRSGCKLRTTPPYSVQAVDTTGAGDSFRAGIVYGFLHGCDDDRMVDYASAVAAINCTRAPGVLNSPSASEVQELIDSGSS